MAWEPGTQIDALQLSLTSSRWDPRGGGVCSLGYRGHILESVIHSRHSPVSDWEDPSHAEPGMQLSLPARTLPGILAS